jgi:hypothetical protein
MDKILLKIQKIEKLLQDEIKSSGSITKISSKTR